MAIQHRFVSLVFFYEGSVEGLYALIPYKPPVSHLILSAVIVIVLGIVSVKVKVIVAVIVSVKVSVKVLVIGIVIGIVIVIVKVMVKVIVIVTVKVIGIVMVFVIVITIVMLVVISLDTWVFGETWQVGLNMTRPDWQGPLFWVAVKELYLICYKKDIVFIIYAHYGNLIKVPEQQSNFFGMWEALWETVEPGVASSNGSDHGFASSKFVWCFVRCVFQCFGMQDMLLLSSTRLIAEPSVLFESSYSGLAYPQSS